MSHICIRELVIIWSVNDLLPVRHQTIARTHWLYRYHVDPKKKISKILIKIRNFPSWKYLWKCPLQNICHFCSGLSGLIFRSKIHRVLSLNITGSINPTGMADDLGIFLISDKTDYDQISQNFEAMRSRVSHVVSIWNLTCVSAAQLPSRLSNFRATGEF